MDDLFKLLFENIHYYYNLLMQYFLPSRLLEFMEYYQGCLVFMELKDKA
jgi:hypothetical protein